MNNSNNLSRILASKEKHTSETFFFLVRAVSLGRAKYTGLRPVTIGPELAWSSPKLLDLCQPYFF